MSLGRILFRVVPISARLSIRDNKVHRFGQGPFAKVDLHQSSCLKIFSTQMGSKRWAHNMPLTYDFARERIMLVLRLFDKIDGEKITLDSHFVDDLGLDSLDHTEIIMMMEDEFLFEIPDKDAEKLLTPRDILRYITDHEEAYEELQKLQAHHHHHGDGHGHGHPEAIAHASAGSHIDNAAMNPSKRHFSSLSYTSKRWFINVKNPNAVFPTSFDEAPKKEINFEDVEKRVLNVCSKYDKIDSSKLNLSSHFVDDLGLDSLDHVEIMMELEDEFGLEVPDQDAEKLMRPAEVAKYIYKKLEERSLSFRERKL